MSLYEDDHSTDLFWVHIIFVERIHTTLRSISSLKLQWHPNVWAQDELVNMVKPRMEELQGSQISDFLFALAMVDARHQLETAKSLVASFIGDKHSFAQKSTNSLIDFAWALLALDLVSADLSKDFTAVLNEIFERETPQNREALLKMFDVFCTLELEHQYLGITIPANWKNACTDADRMEMDRLESSKLHNEVMMRFDKLRGSSNGMKWQLMMTRNEACGPFRVDMLDKDTKIALDLEIISWPTQKHLKHRLLERQGYRMVNLQYWDWRQARTEEDQNLFLEAAVTNALKANPLPALESKR